MSAEHQTKKQEAEEANKRMSKQFKENDARAATEANSEAEMANREMQEEFYGEGDNNNQLPFHIESNNPPIKK